MNKAIVALAEEFIWSNFKGYLLNHQSCLLDLLCPIDNFNSNKPIERYKDLLNWFDAHIGLGSYVTGQAAQFSKTPYITMNIATVPTNHCGVTCIVGFDIVYATDVPPAPDEQTKYIGSSSEAVAAFRADIGAALNELFFYAYGDAEIDEDGKEIEPNRFYTQSFYDAMYNQEITDPIDSTKKAKWAYNIIGDTDDEVTMSEVSQLKREDRSTQLNVFHMVYKIDISHLYGTDVDCGC